MANSRSCLLLLALLLVSAASQPSLVVVGSPTPVIKSAAPQQSAVNEVQPPKAKETSQQQPNQLAAGASAQQQPKANAVTDKLRRGLTNFINHLNPAGYFVPNSAQLASVAGKQAPKATSTREPPTIINDGPSADAVIKGPNRLVQARPLGGPLRWGRR